MKHSSLYSFALTGLMFAFLSIPVIRLHAQTDVEIEVAGPWSYVTDPSDAMRVILIAPSTPTLDDHEFLVQSGAKVNSISTTPLVDGIYKLDFSLATCTTSSQKHIPLFDVSVSAQAVSNAISMKNGRYAISLPKPCWYEMYDSAHALIDAQQISGTTPDEIYATWMVLHYSISDSSQPAALTGSDDNGNLWNSLIPFKKNATDGIQALSVILYNDALGHEDLACDSHSAHYFDEVAHVFWGQNNLFYLFPELSGPGQQSARYNYGKCSYAIRAHAAGMKQYLRTTALKTIESIQMDVKGDTPQQLKHAQRELSTLKEDLQSHWNNPLPEVVEQDLAGTASVIEDELERKTKRHGGTPPVLILTSWMLVTGRIDCHAPEVDINNTVN